MVYQRRHVEVLDTTNVPFAPFAIDGLDGPLERRLLSEDPADGAFTAIVRLPPGWHHDGPWAPSTAFDAFVLAGSVSFGDQVLARHGYTYRPAGYPSGPIASEQGAELLVMTYGALASAESDEAVLGDPRAIAALALEDVPVRQPLTDKVGLGLVSQTLRLEPDSGERVFVISVEEGGFTDERIEWHDCIEEIYTIEGEISTDHPDDRIVLGPGSYCFRPAGIPHGPFATLRQPKRALIRVDCTLVNHYCSLEEARRMWRDYPAELLDPVVAARIA
jgi:quercetin dioxygenase-like cupin family protein